MWLFAKAIGPSDCNQGLLAEGMADALEGPVRRLLSSSGALGRGGGGRRCSGGVPAVCPGLNRWQNKLLITLEKASGSAHLFMISRSLRRSFFPVSSKNPSQLIATLSPLPAPLPRTSWTLIWVAGRDRVGGKWEGRGDMATELPVQQQNEEGARRKLTT